MFSCSSNESIASENKLSDDEDYAQLNVLPALFPSKDFVQEINLFFKESEICSGTKSHENALLLNEKMQNTLQDIKSMLEDLMKKCRIKYKYNEQVLKQLRSKETKNTLKGPCKSYLICGIPFFKTKHKFSHPPNDDYIRRKKCGEIFPSDILYEKQSYWPLKDKTAIIQGVKLQVVEHLSSKRRSEPCTSSSHETIKNKQVLLREPLPSLLSQCDKNFKICWYRICTEFVKSRKEHVCEAMWNMYLKPGIYRGAWSEKENKLLLKAAPDNNFQNWSEIAKLVGNRSELQCFTQYFTVSALHQSEKITRWTPADDEKLLKVVKKCSMNNIIRWNLVKQHFPNLKKKQLHHRYAYSIDPNINKNKFTRVEDCAIMAAIDQFGESFKEFPLGLFPGRTIVQIRNRWHNTLKYSGKHSCWTIEEDKKLLELVDKYGEGNYSIIASEFSTKARNGVRQRYLTIKRFLEKNPNVEIENWPRKQKSLLTDITIENWQQKIFKNGKIANVKPKKIEDSTLKYYKSLRCLEKKYYQFFKFSYDYSFKKETFSLYSITNLDFLIDLLEIRIDTLSDLKLKFNAADYCALQNLVEYREKETHNKIRKDSILSPSWPTLLGFRGVCIQCASTIHTRSKNEDNNSSEKKDAEKGEFAKKLFRKRFYTLFYRTALLSRLDCFIPHEILLSNSKILGNIAKNDFSQQNCRKRRNSSPEPYDIRIKEIKEEI